MSVFRRNHIKDNIVGRCPILWLQVPRRLERCVLQISWVMSSANPTGRAVGSCDVAWWTGRAKFEFNETDSGKNGFYVYIPWSRISTNLKMIFAVPGRTQMFLLYRPFQCQWQLLYSRAVSNTAKSSSKYKSVLDTFYSANQNQSLNSSTNWIFKCAGAWKELYLVIQTLLFGSCINTLPCPLSVVVVTC